MSPTIFKERGLRFFFFSREETRVHVHVSSAEGRAKVWIEPSVELERNDGLSPRDLRQASRLAEERRDEIRTAWDERFRP